MRNVFHLCRLQFIPLMFALVPAYLELDKGKDYDDQYNHIGHRGSVTEIRRILKTEVIDILRDGNGSICRTASRNVHDLIKELQCSGGGGNGSEKDDWLEHWNGDGGKLPKGGSSVQISRLIN